jgi:hypothetical protein
LFFATLTLVEIGLQGSQSFRFPPFPSSPPQTAQWRFGRCFSRYAARLAQQSQRPASTFPGHPFTLHFVPDPADVDDTPLTAVLYIVPHFTHSLIETPLRSVLGSSMLPQTPRPVGFAHFLSAGVSGRRPV